MSGSIDLELLEARAEVREVEERLRICPEGDVGDTMRAALVRTLAVKRARLERLQRRSDRQ